MAGGRQAWCPRCDEVRGARPGADCPVCGRRLLALPPERPGQAQPGRTDRLFRRLKALTPAAGAAGVALLVLAVVASAFAAGRLTRTTPSAPAAAPTTTLAGFLDEGAETGLRDFNWEARSGGISVRLRSVTVGARFTRLELHLDGVPRGRGVSALDRLRIRDLDGRDLLAEGVIDHIATATSHRASGGGLDAEVVLDRALDQGAVASVELGGLTLARPVAEELRASLLDPELRRLVASNGDDSDDRAALLERRDCPGCRLRATCPGCRTVRVTGTAYRRGRVVIAVEAVGPVARSVLNPIRRRVVVTDEHGSSELPGWIDADGDSGIISFGADLLAVVGDPAPDDRTMVFRVAVEALAEQAVAGTWTIREAGG
jgi:hypothetical protein